MESEIVEKTTRDDRIIYLGEVQRHKLLALEKGADILVNPRINGGLFTRYSFPSKNMEYLSSGRPMVGFKLDGIPDEYDQFINYFQQASPEAMAGTIIQCVNHWEESLAKAGKSEKTYAQK